MPLELRPLSSALGVEALGLDLSKVQPKEVQTAVVAAWYEHHLVLIRGQDISLDDQKRFALWFGDLDEISYPSGVSKKLKPESSYISNTREEGRAREGPLLLHSDHYQFEKVLPAICLYAEEATTTGGETLFANAVLAYERLTQDLKHRVETLTALHVQLNTDYGDRRYRVAMEPTAPQAVHPIVMVHPATRRPLLGVSQLMTDHIVGLSDSDSEGLLAELLTYLEDPAVQYEHQWQTNDLLIWDNRALLHGRRDFASTERRSLRRLQVDAA